MAVVPLTTLPRFVCPTFATRQDKRAYGRWIEQQVEREQYLPKAQQCQQVQEFLSAHIEGDATP